MRFCCFDWRKLEVWKTIINYVHFLMYWTKFEAKLTLTVFNFLWLSAHAWKRMNRTKRDSKKLFFHFSYNWDAHNLSSGLYYNSRICRSQDIHLSIQYEFEKQIQHNTMKYPICFGCISQLNKLQTLLKHLFRCSTLIFYKVFSMSIYAKAQK